MIKRLSVVCCLFATTLFAQNQYTPVRPIPVGDILLTLPSSHMADANTWEVRFSHRFNQSVDGNGIHSLFGLDSGANVGLGLSYVPFRDFEVALMRQSTLETFEGSLKYAVVQQANAIPLSAAIRAGIDYRNAEQINERASYFAQAILSRQFGSRLDLYVAPSYVTNAGRVISGDGSTALFEHALNAPVGILVQVMPALSIVAEIIPENRDLPEAFDADFGWAIGVKKAIGGHLFEIILTNNSGMTTDQYISSTYNGVPFKSNEKRLGFNIERRWGKGAKR